MSTLTAEDIKFLTTPTLGERLKSRAAGFVRALGKRALQRTVESNVFVAPEIQLPTPQPEATTEPLDMRMTGTEKIEAAKNSGQWQRVEQVQAAYREQKFQADPLGAPVPASIVAQEASPIHAQMTAEGPAALEYQPKHRL